MSITLSSPPRHRATAQGAPNPTSGTNKTTPATGVEKVHTDTSSASRTTAQWLEHANSLQHQGYVIAGLKQRVAECRTRPVLGKAGVPGAGDVGLSVSDSGNLKLLGLQNCESRWCSHCWGEESKAREEFIAYALKGAESVGLVAGMLTLTASHVTKNTVAKARELGVNAVHLQDSKELFQLMVSSWRTSISGNRGTRLNATSYAYYRAAETTMDDLTRVRPSQVTGNHFHYHVLLLAESREQLEEHASLRREFWKQSCETHGLDVDLAKGTDLKVVGEDESAEWIAQYIAKGEGMDKVAAELTQSSVKQGQQSRRCSPEQVLRNIALLKPSKIRTQLIAQWRALEEASRGVRWKSCSRSFTELAALGVELEDEVTEDDTPAVSDRVAVCDWDEVCPLIPEITSVLETMKIMWNGKADNGKGTDLFDILCFTLEGNGVAYEVVTDDEFTERLRVAAADRHRLEDEGIDEVVESVQLSLDVAGHREAADRMRAWAWGLSA